MVYRFDSNRCQNRCLEMFGDSEMKEDDEYRNSDIHTTTKSPGQAGQFLTRTSLYLVST